MKRDDSPRQFWRVTVRWQDVCLDGRNHGEQSVTYRFPPSWSESNAYEAAAMRWDEGIDWTPSEYARACRTYKASAKLVRLSDLGAPL